MRREAMVRAALVQYYTKLIQQNKVDNVDPAMYANIPWIVAHMALENTYDENDSPDTKIEILKNITCLNRGLLDFLIRKMNAFTY